MHGAVILEQPGGAAGRGGLLVRLTRLLALDEGGGEEALTAPEAEAVDVRLAGQVEPVVRLCHGVTIVGEDLHQLDEGIATIEAHRHRLRDERQLARGGEETGATIVLGGERRGEQDEER